MGSLAPWFMWALLSGVFAALTAVLAKMGLGSIGADIATLVRVAFILPLLGLFVHFTGQWSNPLTWPAKAWIFLFLSALATAASWVCYFRALQAGDAYQVAPVDKLSVVLVAVFAV